MSLTSALDSAKSAITTSSQLTSIVSRNIANVNSTTATRKYANVATGADGSVSVMSVSQSTNLALFRNKLDATSENASLSALTSGLGQLATTVGDTEDEISPASLVGKLQSALTAYSASPDSADLARSAMQAAKNLAQGLNDASDVVETVRRDADNAISVAAGEMNDLLAQFKSLNDKIVSGSKLGADVTDYMDQRDQIVSQLSEYVGVTVGKRANNDMVLYTDSGVTMFETTPRTVSYSKSIPMDAGQAGNSLYIDGVAVTGENSTMPIQSGKIFGLTQLRDQVSVTYQNQLDQIAQQVVSAFSETSSGKPVFGIFTDPSADSPDKMKVDGLAGRLSISDNLADFPLRDGALGSYNSAGASGFADHINQLIDNLNAKQTFDASGGIETSATLVNFASSSVGWLEGVRSNAQNEAEYQSTVLQRTQEALSDATGINLDDELTQLLQFEQSYQASAKLISTIDQMLQVLLDSVH
ncbi:flagellar hook-associated protein FlgK [Consotaella salsifontis]|uniref:Flagellar hook-associated protein 1 n=1 Tax=Consotaella salsifontis TaxID=1365950 RepID=A0A1T4NSH7_9HYPH|nr:flagellar hook-associated protein FlgK [Consotaella salsifontis]SJZ82077.1 flagellar hook-associated protein 1 FlgK [Consotaella salsifontis]